MSFVSDTVNQVICRYGTRDPFELAKALRINILEVLLPDSVNGFYQKQNNKSIIFLNCTLTKKEKKVILAHELGHFCLHNNFNSIFLSSSTNFNMNKFEKEADCFAVLLIAEDSKTLYEQYGITTKQQIADFYGFDIELINRIYDDKTLKISLN